MENVEDTILREYEKAGGLYGLAARLVREDLAKEDEERERIDAEERAEVEEEVKE